MTTLEKWALFASIAEVMTLDAAFHLYQWRKVAGWAMGFVCMSINLLDGHYLWDHHGGSLLPWHLLGWN